MSEERLPLYLLPAQRDSALAAGTIRLEDKGRTWDDRPPAIIATPLGPLQLGPGGVNAWSQVKGGWKRGWR